MQFLENKQNIEHAFHENVFDILEACNAGVGRDLFGTKIVLKLDWVEMNETLLLLRLLLLQDSEGSLQLTGGVYLNFAGCQDTFDFGQYLIFILLLGRYHLIIPQTITWFLLVDRHKDWMDMNFIAVLRCWIFQIILIDILRLRVKVELKWTEFLPLTT